jgi:small subunit ribosomal protein S17
MSKNLKSARTAQGVVISAKMNKTICVKVGRLVPHPSYGKYVGKTTKLVAHDEDNNSRVGDKVTIVSCRPISKRKAWKLEEII